MAKHIKCVAVGDAAVGKTCLLTTYSEGKFPEEYIPTVFDNFTTSLQVDKEKINLSLWDTAGSEDYDNLRLLVYPKTDIIILCINLADKNTLINVSSTWIPEIKKYCDDKPIILVGTQKDRRALEESSSCISGNEAKLFAVKHNLTSFVETSAKLNQGLNECFEEVCRQSLKYSKANEKANSTGSCCRLL